MYLTLPNHQVNQDGDQADGDEREEHHQPVRRVLKVQLFLDAVPEVVAVDLEEQFLGVRVGIVAVEYPGAVLQAGGQDAVRPATVEEATASTGGLQLETLTGVNNALRSFKSLLYRSKSNVFSTVSLKKTKRKRAI